MNLMHVAGVAQLVGEEAVWQAVSALQPGQVHCAFDEWERVYKCLSAGCFVNAQRVVVEGVN